MDEEVEQLERSKKAVTSTPAAGLAPGDPSADRSHRGAPGSDEATLDHGAIRPAIVELKDLAGRRKARIGRRAAARQVRRAASARAPYGPRDSGTSTVAASWASFSEPSTAV